MTPLLLLALLLASTPVTEAELQGDGMTVRIESRDERFSGTIELKGNRYPFTATSRDGNIVGTFTADGDAFDFTLSTNDRKNFVLESGGRKYRLQRRDAPAAAQQQGEALPRTIILQPHTLSDPTTKLEFATVLIPRGWVVEPGMLWRIDRGQFVTNTTRIADPKTGVQIVSLPIDQFNADPTLVAAARQQGVPLISGGLELAEGVPTVEQYITQIALPRYSKVSDLKVIRTEEMPQIAQAVAQANAQMIAAANQMGREVRLQAARTRVEFSDQAGKEMEADVYCALLTSWDPRMNAMAQQQRLPAAYLFWPERLYAFIAPKGKLDASTPLLQAIVGSSRPTVRWTAYIDNLQRIRQQGVLDRQKMELAARAEITESQRQTWDFQTKSEARIAEQFGDLMTGVNRYVEPSDPTGNHVLLPATFKQAWADGQKNYILSNDPTYNPNQDGGLNGSWQEMRPPG